jgi:ClpP class serine protease
LTRVAQHRFQRSGNLALDPSAFFFLFAEREELENERVGDVEIITVCGPLTHHGEGWFDSYDEILGRVDAACAGTAATICLKLDSPGGDLSGCFEASRAVRARCKAAGKRLVSYVEGNACSGGYALACAAETIYVAPTAIVGSIGVLNTRVDATANDAAYGIRFSLVGSGKYKADGHPHQRLSDSEVERTQAVINSLAAVFFELVAEQRGIDAGAVGALEAGIFHGESAIGAGLVDQVMSFDVMLAALAGDGETPMSGVNKVEATEEEETPKAGKDLDDARAALQKAAEGEGDDAERARRALAALDGKSDDDEEEEERGEDAAASTAVSSQTAGEMGTTITTLSTRLAKLESQNEALSRREFLASRPDLAPSLVKVLETKPLTEVRAIVNAMPKPKAGELAATATVPSTRGAGQTSPAISASGGTPSSDSRDSSWLDKQMGLSVEQSGVEHAEHALRFNLAGLAPATRKPAAAPAEGSGSK